MMLALVIVYTALFKREELGRLRGDVLAALAYVSNWFQIWVGQGYTAEGQFAPLRHLWSLAVEEQFYLVWPIVMIALIRVGKGRLPSYSRWLLLAAIAVSVAVGLLFEPTRAVDPATTPDAFWNVGGHAVNKTETLYLSTLTRSTGLARGRRAGPPVAPGCRDARPAARQGRRPSTASPSSASDHWWCWRGGCTSSPTRAPIRCCSAADSLPSTSPPC